MAHLQAIIDEAFGRTGKAAAGGSDSTFAVKIKNVRNEAFNEHYLTNLWISTNGWRMRWMHCPLALPEHPPSWKSN